MSDDAVSHLSQFLNALELTDAVDPELADTPRRFKELLEEQFSGLREPAPVLSTFPPPAAEHKEPVLLCALPFQSMCVHHLVPFFGTIDVAYIPGEKMVGFGSIGRVIDYFAKRPQMQERLVMDIADYLQVTLEPLGVVVRCRARQLCMEYRGAHKPGVLISYASYGELTAGPQRTEIIRQFVQAEHTL